MVVFPVNPGELCDSTSKLATTASYQILSNLFANHPTIRRHIISATNRDATVAVDATWTDTRHDFSLEFRLL
jgi:hypothetical protein